MKKVLKPGILAIKLLSSVVIYLMTRRTPAYGYQAMIELYCLTQGRSNDLMAKVISVFKPYQIPAHETGVLGQLDHSKISSIRDEIDRNGYYIFPTKLSSAMCDELMKVALQEKAVVIGRKEMMRYNENSPQGVRYDFPSAPLLKNDSVIKLMNDPTLRAVAGAYLRAKPKIDIVTLWWQTTFEKEPNKEAAQFYHFDMDRVKWLKFFFYITDVKTENGPHCFVAKSHRTKGTPKNLLKQGYVRLADEEVLAEFPPEDVIEFNGPKGLILAEDTRGLHKGKHVLNGHRLIFQLEFTNSLFGAKYDENLISY